MPHRRRGRIRRKASSSRSPGTWCRRRRGRRPSIRNWRRSTRSSPRAWPRSRRSGIRRRASWPQPHGVRWRRRCARRALRAAFRKRARPRASVAAGVGDRGAAVVLVAALGTFGVWQWRGGSGGGDARPRASRRVRRRRRRSRSPGAVPEIAATVPEDIRKTGRLMIGVNVPYAPNEFKNSAGDDRRLRRRPDERGGEDAGADARVPGVGVREHHPVGARAAASTSGCRRSPTPWSARQKVDFVTYFEAGTLWAQRTGSSGGSGRRVRVEGWRDARVHPRDGGDPGQERSVRGGGPSADRQAWSTPGRTN